jgi:hypothetical protein
MDGTDNWSDTVLARDIAIWRASELVRVQNAELWSQRQFEERAMQTWLDDGGSFASRV